ncbi:MAG TPA: hypothetical protein VK968_16490, partial [Roseimicrobium sp.]|nr:hypothetical protein [Roseimicrobium sp.]
MKTTLLKSLAIAILFAGSLFRSIGVAAPAVTPKPMAPAPPGLTSAEPRGVQLGETVRIKLVGSNLVQVSAVKAHMDGATASLLTEPAATSNAVWIELKTPAGIARGAVELSVVSGAMESGRFKIYTDDLPQQTAASGSSPFAGNSSVWGVLEKAGKVDEISVLPQGSHTLVALLSAKSVGSKLLDPVIQVLDEKGAPVPVESGSTDGGDSFVAFRPASRGPFRIQVRDGMLAGSKDHYYRLSVGTIPFVTGWFPLGVTKGQSARIELSGYNLSHPTIQSVIGSNGVVQFPASVLQTRTRTALKLESGDTPEVTEREPNDTAQKAQSLAVPGSVSGRFVRSKAGAPDPDCYRITAKAGERLMIETVASRQGSLADTRVEVLNPDGTPVPYLLLQAVRDSSVTFRGVDANGNDIRLVNWEEMDLDQFLYIQGDVSRIIRMPRGPDSGALFYASGGRRESFFSTTATAHALDSPAYIVVPHAPGTRLVPNGLPVFPIHYVNDDSSDREIGTDSRLQFTAPADGTYVIRVSDARGFGGELYTYRLSVRSARPDFVVTLTGMNPTVNAGSGRSFVVKVDRKDGFEGPVTVETTGVPAGLEISSPVVVP